MSILAMLGPIKGLLMNKYVIMGVIIVALYGYHYFKVTGLEKDVLTLETNVVKITGANRENEKSIIELSNALNKSKSDRNIVTESYDKQIQKLKAIIFNLEKKPVYKEKIVIKDCEIKVKKLTKEDDENSIIHIINHIGL